MHKLKNLWSTFINKPRVASILDNTHVQVITIFALIVLFWVFVFTFPKTAGILMILVLLGAMYALVYYMIGEFKYWNRGGK